MSTLRLRPLTDADEEQFASAHHELQADGFTFGLSYTPGMPWADYLALRSAQRRGAHLTGRWVPNTFLVADVRGVIVGRTSIRHELNDFLLRLGGHIGYGVRPAHRRRGYATEILRQSLNVAHGMGINPVLVTCDEGNVASARTIERCGGVLDDVVPVDGAPAKRRYWIR